MANEPLVSVIIPCYNSEDYIEECLNSVINQSYDKLEIIVVDDGSKDNSADIVSRFETVMLIKQENSGACAARNKGLFLSKGKYIKFLDADDTINPQSIANQVAIAEGSKKEIIVYGDYERLVDGELHSTINKNLNGADQLSSLVNTDLMTTTPLHHRKMLVDIGGFDTRFKNGQEWNLHIRLAVNNVFHYSPGVTYRRRIHDGPHRISTVRSKDDKFTENEINKCFMTMESIAELDDKADVSSAFARRLWWFGRRAIRHNDLAGAKNCFYLAKKIGKDSYKDNWSFSYKTLNLLFGEILTERAICQYHKVRKTKRNFT